MIKFFCALLVLVGVAMGDEYLYKIVSPEAWERSQGKKEVERSYVDDLFIHLSTQEQLSHVVKKFWAGEDYVILKLKTDKLVGRLVFETNPGGTNRYYHLYDGFIPLEAVQEASVVKK